MVFEVIVQDQFFFFFFFYGQKTLLVTHNTISTEKGSGRLLEHMCGTTVLWKMQ